MFQAEGEMVLDNRTSECSQHSRFLGNTNEMLRFLSFLVCGKIRSDHVSDVGYWYASIAFVSRTAASYTVAYLSRVYFQ